MACVLFMSIFKSFFLIFVRNAQRGRKLKKVLSDVAGGWYLA